MVEEIDNGVEGINANCYGRTVRKNRLIKTAKTSTKVIVVCIVGLFLLNNFSAMAQNSENTQEIDVENDLPWMHTWTNQEQVIIYLKNVNNQKNLLLKFENPIASELIVNDEVFDTIENGITNIFIFVINNATTLNFQVDAGTKLTIENIPGARINCNNTRISGWTFQNQYGKYVSEIGIPTDSAPEITLTPLSYPSLWPFPIRPPDIRPKPLPIIYIALMNNSISTYGVASSGTTETLQKGTDCLKLVSDKPARFRLTITPKHFEPMDYAVYEDGSTGTDEDDCVLWFDVYQNDNDNDGLMYREEVHTYGTDPTADNRGEDLDNDDIPIEWEDKWGYDPTIWDDHYTLDPDSDGLENVDEYFTAQWGSDPFYKDIFVEVDWMSGHAMTSTAKDKVITAFANQHIVLHIFTDKEVPHKDNFNWPDDWDTYYNDYFTSNRKGVFRYCVMTHRDGSGSWFTYGQGESPGDMFVLYDANIWFDKDNNQASVFMHELGHNILGDLDDVHEIGYDHCSISACVMNPEPDILGRTTMSFCLYCEEELMRDGLLGV